MVGNAGQHRQGLVYYVRQERMMEEVEEEFLSLSSHQHYTSSGVRSIPHQGGSAGPNPAPTIPDHQLMEEEEDGTTRNGGRRDRLRHRPWEVGRSTVGSIIPISTVQWDAISAVVEESQPSWPVKRQYWDDQIHPKLNASLKLEFDGAQEPAGESAGLNPALPEPANQLKEKDQVEIQSLSSHQHYTSSGVAAFLIRGEVLDQILH